MVHNKKVQRTAAKANRLKRNASRRRINRQTNRTVISPFVKCARTLLSFLPGQTVIKPLADIAFKAFGLTSSSTITGQHFSAANVNFVGVYSASQITVRDMLAFSSVCERDEDREIPVGSQARTRVQTVKMLRLAITLRNTTPTSSKQGNWAACFKPFISGEDNVTAATPYKTLCEMPSAKTAKASQDIVLTIAKFPLYWRCGREMSYNDIIGTLYIGFEDLNRTSYVEITSDQFSCSATIACDVKILVALPGSQKNTFGYNIHDGYSNFSHHVVTYKKRIVSNDLLTGVTCTAGEKDCSVSGAITSLLSLEQMEI